MKIGTCIEATTGWLMDMRNPQSALEDLLSSMERAVTEFQLDIIEIPMDALFFYPALFTEEALAQMRRLAEKCSFEFTTHLPVMWLDLSGLNEGMRMASVRSVLDGLKKGLILNPLGCPIHLTGECAGEIANSDWGQGEKQAFLHGAVEQARRSLAQITQAVEPEKLWVENTAGMPFDPILSVAKEQGISICFDVGHLALQGGDAVTFIESHFEGIREVHLHDVVRLEGANRSTILRDHQPLGSGFLDMKGIINALCARNYDGILLVEVMRKDYLPQSLEVLRSLLSR